MIDLAAMRMGVSAGDTVRLLRELVTEARNAVAGGGRKIDEVRDEYLAWVEDAELQLRSRFVADEVWGSLHSGRYWHVRNLHTSSPRPFPLIDQEARFQADRLEKLAYGIEENHKSQGTRTR